MIAEPLEQECECPYCGEEISVIVDLSNDGYQDYVEDCEVCCRPMQIRINIEDGFLSFFACERSD
ncbi:MAG: CPXCG motif-containing cysteine-rich protein [Gammaproteobacteria bacterium]